MASDKVEIVVVHGNVRCPKCGARNVDMEVLEQVVPEPWSDLIRHTCTDCGYTEDVLVRWNDIRRNPELN